jgi:aldehyde:ferredoxin oxidoreductase
MSNTMKAIWNQFLSIDLTQGKVETTQIPEEYYRRFIGGKALGGKLMNDFKLYEVDPLSPENVLLMMVGPVSGTLFPGAAKAIFSTRSPLTGIYLDSATGGRMSNAIKRCGYDGIFIKGKASKPSYIYLHNEEVQILPADEYWGMPALQCEDALRAKHGIPGKGSVLTIGPAGENMVSYACCCNDFYHQSGRGGTGAVLGSKNIKGMVIFGQKRVELFDDKGFKQLAAEWMRKARSNERVQFRGQYGTLTTLDMTQKLGIVPVRNFRDGGIWEGYDVVNAINIRQGYVKDDLTCMGCPMPCGKHIYFNYQGKEENVGGPEYETLSLVGSNLDIRNLEGIGHINLVCDELGIDTISAGVVVSCAIEAFERGDITEKDTDGIVLKWGDVAAIEQILTKVAHREGIGDSMAKGVRIFAEEYGLDESLAQHVKGMELPGYDPRGTKGYALEYSVADRGGCHRRARPIRKEAESEKFRFGYEGKAEIVIESENLRGYNHSLPICDYVPTFFGMKPDDHAELLYLAMGWEVTAEELLRVGERAINMARLFNNRCGIGAGDDTVSKRFLKEALKTGPSAGQKVDPEGLAYMLSEYYEMRGWDPDGKILPETVKALELE